MFHRSLLETVLKLPLEVLWDGKITFYLNTVFYSQWLPSSLLRIFLFHPIEPDYCMNQLNIHLYLWRVYKATPKGRKDLNLTSVCHAKARLSTLWLHILIQGLLRTEDKGKDFQFCRMPWTSSSGSLVAPRNLKGMSPMHLFNFLNFAEGVDVKDITSHVQQSVWKCFVHYMFPFIPQSGNRLPTYFRAVRYLRYETSYFFRDVQRAAMRNFHGYASCLLTVSWI